MVSGFECGEGEVRLVEPNLIGGGAFSGRVPKRNGRLSIYILSILRRTVEGPGGEWSERVGKLMTVSGIV